MVASQILTLNVTNSLKPLQVSLLPPLEEITHVLSLEDLDFSDVFGPVTSQESVFEEPQVIQKSSHSFVGPTSCVCSISNLSKITLVESHDRLEIVGKVHEDDQENISSSFLGLEDFEFLKLVGRGAFGKVYQVRKRGSSDIFAMKVVRKDKSMEKDHAGYMKTERDILTKIEHPFIVQLRYSFQTKYRLYFVLDFINGGHLFFQLYRQGLFREDLARVYAAEIVSAVSHLHEHGIMHRDLKPENILLDAEGHAMLTDFGLAKQFDDTTKSNSMCGTLEYMAPEIILAKGHDKAVDWWSVGVLLFEMLTGNTPFSGNRNKIQQKILKDKVKLPPFLSSEAHSLIKGLMHKEGSKRLGSGPRGGDEIKAHKWFKSINWKKLEAREIQPGFIPQVAGKHCIANFDERWTNAPLLDSPASTPKGENPFKGFNFVNPKKCVAVKNEK